MYYGVVFLGIKIRISDHQNLVEQTMKCSMNIIKCLNQPHFPSFVLLFSYISETK